MFDSPLLVDTSTTIPAAEAPKVWVLFCKRAGENTQLTALAEGLGWPFAVKQFNYRDLEPLIGLPFLPTKAGIADVSVGGPLEGPWPEIVLTAGRQNEPIARWIRRQSGGRTRIVHVGRPWSPVSDYDLVVATRQYGLPEAPNVLLNDLPLHRVSGEALGQALGVWAKRVIHLPRPRIAVLVGGPAGPFAFGPKAAARLGEMLSARANAIGGSLLITTSARTPEAASDALEAAITAPALLYRYNRSSGENPYLGFLSLADEVVVTADSLSMVAEALATGKPVRLFHPGGFFGKAEPFGRDSTREDRQVSPSLYRSLLSVLPARVMKDMRPIHDQLIASGRVTWLGDEAAQPAAPGRPQPSRDVARAVARVRALVRREAPRPVREPLPTAA